MSSEKLLGSQADHFHFVLYSSAMFLLTLLVASCAVGFMAPKVRATASKAKAKAKAKSDGADPKRKALMQSNLASQARNAKAKLAEVAKGSVEVSEEEKASLECKIDFFESYKKLPRGSAGNNEMLEQFTTDKTCQRWADRQKVIEQTQVEKATAQSGYMSRA